MALLVAGEGLAGCGKTTAINLIAQDLRSLGLRVEIIDIETVPDGQKLLAMSKKFPLDNLARSMCLWISRMQQHDAIVECENHNCADVIFADRFIGTPWAFDGYGNKVPREFLQWILGHIQRQADITFLFEVPPEVALARKESETTANLPFARRVAQGYRELAYGLGWVRVDATRSPQEIKTDCLKVILAALPSVKS